jgi:hypothetical protein
MKIKKIKKLICKEINSSYQKGWTEGYDIGFDAAKALESHDYDNGFKDGLEKEQQRIQHVLDIHIRWAMESGKGNDAINFTKIKEIITPIEVDYSEEAYQKYLEQEGF